MRIFEGVYCAWRLPDVVFLSVCVLGTHSFSYLMPLKWVLFYLKTEISSIEHINHKIFTATTFSPFPLPSILLSSVCAIKGRIMPKYFVTQHQTHFVHFALSGCSKKPCTVRVFHLSYHFRGIFEIVMVLFFGVFHFWKPFRTITFVVDWMDGIRMMNKTLTYMTQTKIENKKRNKHDAKLAHWRAYKWNAFELLELVMGWRR